jgi:hypothetical protein
MPCLLQSKQRPLKQPSALACPQVAGNYQAGHAQLQVARKLKPGFAERYVMYIRDQEHTHKLQSMGAEGGTQGVNLVSYIEFQRNWK